MEAWLSSPWFWGVTGLLLMLGELLLAGFYLLPLGVAALVAALAAWLLPGFADSERWLWASGVFVASSLASLFTIRPIMLRVMYKGGGEFNVDALVHQQALVTEDIDPVRGTGQVRIGREAWAATSEKELAIPAGSTVEVVSIQGNRAVVRSQGS
jgi:membrane protein implicated in regulation of membrane protease activity